MSDSCPVVVRRGEAVVPPAAPPLELRHHHHHAANETYVYVIRGSITIEFGPEGTDRVEARAGDFFIVPSNVIHREATGPAGDLEAFVVRVGAEPEYVDVDGPTGAGR